MCDSRTCRYPCGEEEFRRYADTLAPDRIMYPVKAAPGETRYGVMVNHAAQQWEIVAAQGDRSRHVAFISTLCCLDRVLNMAAEISL